jgi:hypothetical protein
MAGSHLSSLFCGRAFVLSSNLHVQGTVYYGKMTGQNIFGGVTLLLYAIRTYLNIFFVFSDALLLPCAPGNLRTSRYLEIASPIMYTTTGTPSLLSRRQIHLRGSI